MKKQLLILASLLSVSQYSLSQTTFQKTYNRTNWDEAHSVQQTSDGGYIIVGATNVTSASQIADVYLIKTNAIGDTIWTRTFGGANDDVGESVKQTSDGGYIIAGYTQNGVSSWYDAMLIKTDASGNIIWNKSYGGTNNLQDAAYDVQITINGDFIVVGSSYHAGYNEVYLFKTDSLGNRIWAKFYGGSNEDVGYSVRQSSDGGYIICGVTASYGAQNGDVWLLKTDSAGTFQWSKTFGASIADYGFDLDLTFDGGYILVGSCYISDLIVIKTNANGDTLWTKEIYGSATEVARSVQQTADSGYIIAGFTSTFGGDNVYLIKMDVNGNILWSKTIGASGTNAERAFSIQQTNDDGFIIAGSARDTANVTSMYLIKTDSVGNSGCFENTVIPTLFGYQILLSSPTPTISTSDTSFSPILPIGSGATVVTKCLSVNVNEMEANNLMLVFPNPSSGNFTIEFTNSNHNKTVNVFNTIGELIFTSNTFIDSRKEIILKNISNGIYFLKVYDGEKYYCKKIIIEQD